MEPLASKIRPQSLNDFVGQEHILGNNKPLRLAIENKIPFSFILWGPPGSGKTTIARIYASSLGIEMHELSAVSSGKKDIQKIIDGRTKILFLDEIHRFNKAQQDFLLPYVESGEIILIGATIENPSFEIISALLSRCHVFVFNQLKEEDIKKIIERTKIKIDDKTKNWLASIANGDARYVINLIEETCNLYGKITIDNLKSASQIYYDKSGEEHYNTISAFIKTMRDSDVNASLYYLARMIKAGEDPKFIARRMIIFASEDIGVAQPTALVVANDVFRAVETIGIPECATNLAHGVVFLCHARKDRSAYDAFKRAMADVEKYGNLPIPIRLRNTKDNLLDDGCDSNLPDKIKDKIYYKGLNSI